MNIDEMESGRELDKAVAVEVMGWRCNRYKCVDGLYPKYGEHEWFRRTLCKLDAGPIPMIPCDHFDNYSTNIAAAWEVVEKMVDLGEVFIIKGDGLRDGTFNPRWTVMCGNLPRTDSNDLPLAICRAALKAVRAKANK